jgi:HlyD family secretion protein
MKRFVIPLVILAALLVGGYFGFRYLRAQQQAATISNFQTATIGRGSLTSTVGATGSVRANQTATLAWQTSGTVEQVSAKVGDPISAGQILATLEQTSLSQNVILAQTDQINAQKALDDLLSSDVARIQAMQAISDTQKTIIDAERALEVFDEQKYEDDLEKARDDIAEADKALEDARDDFEPYKDWDPTNDTRESYEDKLDEAQRKYNETVRVYDLLIMDKAMAQANLDLARARLADAQREYDRLKDGPNPDDVAVLEARLAAAQATLDLANLDAPFAGTITEVNLKPGDQASPGKVSFRLDDLSRLLVDVRISEVDINRVVVGQNVNLTFDAIQGKEYKGVVSEVSQVGATVQGGVEFAVTVELTDPDENVRPGMTAAVNIVVEQLDNVLLVPNRAVRVVDGQRVVYVLRNGEVGTIRITLGATSESVSEVIDGDLRSGDTVILNPPLVFESNGPPPFTRR